MTDRDRLIELFEVAAMEFCNKDENDKRSLIEIAVDTYIANGVTLGKPLVEYLHPIDAYEGLKGKYLVFKADTGEQIVNCFVLRPDKDNTAVEALRFYAYITDNKTLAEDIYKWVGKSKILPPCKVGETLFFFYDNTFANRPNFKPYIYETNDWYFDIDQKGISILPRSIHSYKGKHHYYLGKTVFLTREEAEAKLKELGK